LEKAANKESAFYPFQPPLKRGKLGKVGDVKCEKVKIEPLSQM
jgi:hypothetical protein